jgi:hypothetical protein
MGQFSSVVSTYPNQKEVSDFNQHIIAIATRRYSFFPYHPSGSLIYEAAKAGYYRKDIPDIPSWFTVYGFSFMRAVADPELTVETKQVMEAEKPMTNNMRIIPASQAKCIFIHSMKEYLVDSMASADFMTDPFDDDEYKLDRITQEEIIVLLPENLIIERKPDGKAVLWKKIQDQAMRALLPTIVTTTSKGRNTGCYLLPPPEVYSDASN